MSLHKKPLTQLEEDGLRAHGLDIGVPSQLSDAFRQGVAWAQSQPLKAGQGEAVAIVEYAGYEPANSLKWLNKGLAYMEPGTKLYIAPPATADAVSVMEQSAKLCDERAAYYEGDDDGPEGRRNLACKACASVIRYHVDIAKVKT